MGILTSIYVEIVLTILKFLIIVFQMKAAKEKRQEEEEAYLLKKAEHKKERKYVILFHLSPLLTLICDINIYLYL